MPRQAEQAGAGQAISSGECVAMITGSGDRSGAAASEFDLARRRERRFWLIEDEDALALAAFLEEAKTLAVRMPEKIRRVGIRVQGRFVEIRATEKKLSARENAAVRNLG